MANANTAQLIIADSERNANLFYATNFLAPDPFVFLQINGRRMLVMSDLEVDRARSQSSVEEVLSFTRIAEQAKKRLGSEPGLMDVVDEVLRGAGIKAVEVPRDCGVAYADRLRQLGYEVRPKADPFYPQRMIKSEREIGLIMETIRATEDALEQIIELVSQTEIRADGALWIGGKPLTVELLRRALHLQMMERDCVGQHTIIAPGVQAVDPHNEGSGPLRANEPIVMDVFPQHATSRYYSDMTRTIVRGKASDKVKRMFEAVREGQEIAFGMIRDGVDGQTIHQKIMDRFNALGFHTGEQNGRMQGFFHGTGHGVGLEIHEPPRISSRPDILRSGMVVTVEPGLYYLDAGGMRIEDMVVVEPTGCRIMTQLPRVLEV